MTKPRICMLVAYYPPSAESGARRPYNLVRELCRSGYSVEVVVAAPGVVSPTKGDHGETVIHAVPKGSSTPTLFSRIVSRLSRRFAALALHQPNASYQYHRQLEQLLATSLADGKTILYASAPPGGIVELAVSAARHRSPDQLLIVEFRDPWITSRSGPDLELFRGRYERNRIRTLAEIDSVVAVTTGIADQMIADGARSPAVIAVNGVPDELFDLQEAAQRDPQRNLVMLYLGEFYLGRNPTSLLDALASIRSSTSAELEPFRLEFVGEVDETPAGPLADLLAERGFSDVTRISERVPYQQAKQLLADSDIFLLLAQYQPRQIPNKLYEYLAYRRPIFAIVDEDGETARVLRNTGHGDTMVFPDSPPQVVERALALSIERARAGSPVGDEKAIRALATSAQFAKVINLIKEIDRETAKGQDPA